MNPRTFRGATRPRASRWRIALAVGAWAGVLGFAPSLRAAGDLQSLVDSTPRGGTLRLSPGTYVGSVVVRHPITVFGGGQVTIDGDGRGTVILVQANGVTLEGLHLTNSGSNHDTLDAAIQIRGNDNRVLDNRIDDCLFGIDLQQSNRNVIRGNHIGSKPVDTGVRGDAIRLWYSFENEILGNTITDVRDVVVWYSSSNRIVGNRVSGSRYALHFMYAQHNIVEENHYSGNMVGVFLMYSDGVKLRRNRITGAQGSTGMGIGFKETSNVVVEDNSIIYCAKGIYLDISPYEPDTTNEFRRNHFAFNGVGVVFHNDWYGNVFRENSFEENHVPVGVRGGGSATRNTWEGNHWDDYEGFDRDGDGRGDAPYELRAWADRIWMEIPPAAFFRGSPLFEVIDFLDRLAPFSDPTLIVRDESPRFRQEDLPWRR